MDSEFKTKDLQLILRAITTVRSRWIQGMEDKYEELQADHPTWNSKKLLSDAMTHPDVQKLFEPLIALYGMIGSSSEGYADAIAGILQPENDNVALFEEYQVKKAA